MLQCDRLDSLRARHRANTHTSTVDSSASGEMWTLGEVSDDNCVTKLEVWLVDSKLKMPVKTSG